MGFKLSADGRSCEGTAASALVVECEKQLFALLAVFSFSLQDCTGMASEIMAVQSLIT